MDGTLPTSGPRRRVPILALFVANAVSETGNVLAFVAIPWFVLQTTESAVRTGLTGAAFLLAAVTAGVVGGPIVDRIGFKRTSIVADLAGAVTVALVPLLYHTVGLRFWQLLLLVFLGGFLDAPGHTARQSLVPDLAGKAGMGIERANSVFQGVRFASLLLGPPLAGLLISVFAPGNVLWIDAATFVISAALVAALVPTQWTEAGARGAGRYLADLAEGVVFICRDRLVVWMFGIGVVANSLAVPLVAVVLPVFAREAYGSAVDLGLMLGGFGGGALAGTSLYAVVGARLPRRATLVAAVSLLGVPFWVLIATPPLWASIGALFVAGLTLGPPNPLTYSVLQERTPPRMLGRVLGAGISLSMLGAPVGMVVCGYALEVLGLRPTLLGLSASYLAAGLLAFSSPALRELDRAGK
ncbi:MAG TPA: MFS transporter [Rubrobacter sp.]|nr:MFS transporter [Rubrobacter sp.]